MREDFKSSNWYRYMDEGMRDLVGQTMELLNRAEMKVAGGENEEHDYAYVVFPMAKAYEGFLKKVFLGLGLINKRQYYGEYFRIGRALNPNLPKRMRSGWVYGRLLTWCGGNELPEMLWETWKTARNRIFHFFPDHHEFIGLTEARTLVTNLEKAMEMAIEGCRLK